MENRNIVRTKDGTQARNRYGSCGVLAIAAIKGMRYEDATAWTIKNGMAYKVKNGEVCGMDITASRDKFATFKKIGAKRTFRYVDKCLEGHDEDFFAIVNNAHKLDGVEFGRIKISTFAKNNPRGRFMLVTRNHAVAVIHGKVYENGGNGDRVCNQIINQVVEF